MFSFLLTGSNVKQRIQIEGIRKDPWFQRNYAPVEYSEVEEVNLDDVCAVFDDIEVDLFSLVPFFFLLL